jgi:septation ring formation regulator EzrA
MTELERELSRALERQQQAFERELQNTTEIYIENTKALSREYQSILTEQQRIIEKQSELLRQYEASADEVAEAAAGSNQLSELYGSLLDFEKAIATLFKEQKSLQQQLTEIESSLQKISNF